MFAFKIKRPYKKVVNDYSILGRIKAIAFHVVLIFIAFFLQTSIFPLIPFFTCSPNFLLIITFSYGLLYGEDIGILTGVFCGLLCDMYFNGVFGLYILIYSVLGYANGVLRTSFFEDTITFPMILSIVNGFAYNFYIYVTHFMIRKRFDIIYYVFRVMFPNVLFTLIVTVLIYKLLYKINVLKVASGRTIE